MKQKKLCDLPLDNTEAGFRLKWMEVRNWGTFDKYVWKITPNGQTTLMAGDNGSGKSTVVDALVSLLLPHKLITFNKTSGSKKHDRSFYSYIRGAYKNIQDEHNQARPEFLRDEDTYTVLLACFHNHGYDQTITLAQIFWLENNKTTPKKLFVVSNQGLTIEKDFSGFGSDIRQLKKRLQAQRDTKVFTTYRDYGNYFRKRIGIDNEKALDLFQQMVSMKKVGVLTNFIRERMIEKSDIENRLDKLCRNFENLNQAHESVLKAEDQLEILQPLAEKGIEYCALEQRHRELEQSKESLEGYFAHYEAELFQNEIERLEEKLKYIESELEKIAETQTQLEQEKRELEKSFEDSGGSRLQALIKEIEDLKLQQTRKQKQYDSYLVYSNALKFPEPDQEEVFQANKKQASSLLKETEKNLSAIEDQRVDLAIQVKEMSKSLNELDRELDSLHDRKSKIPVRFLLLRQKIAEHVDVSEEELPFAGELLQVKESEQAWEGAIERLLHGFGLTMLVPDYLYEEVRWYVNQHRLEIQYQQKTQGVRLVYFHAKENVSNDDLEDPQYKELITKLEIKPKHIFGGWIECQLRERFDYICCDEPDEFDFYNKAFTKEGQTKTYQRHEKDDRRSLQNNSQFILGWSNQQKVKALEEEQKQLKQQGQELAEQVGDTEQQRATLENQKDHAKALLNFDSYDAIAWQEVIKRIEKLDTEKQEIESSNDLLKTLRERISSVNQSIFVNNQFHDNLIREQGIKSNTREQCGKQLEAAETALQNWRATEQARDLPLLDALRKEMIGEEEIRLDNFQVSKSKMQDAVITQLGGTGNELNKLSNSIIRQMTLFADRYPVESSEFEVSMEALTHWKNIYYHLKDEDLPRHKERFKELLNEGTINSLALFKHQLEREEQDINKKIQSINQSLKTINYDKETYIVLVTHPVDDPEIRSFRAELKHCLARSLDDSDYYNESKFKKVKALIERFKGREGHSEEDRRWRDKVTDVRNWLTFNASERWRHNDKEREFYSGTNTKSTGQQEKLAYTVLASAIAYQFGLEWGATKSRSFRFIVIDEAFSVGSDKNTRYALELFKQLNLQVLIITPLQKLHVIEHYIRHVHFIHNNEEGSYSQIENLSIDKYQENKSLHQSKEKFRTRNKKNSLTKTKVVGAA